MPVKKKKKFIDKKDAVSFHLVHRSQKDPLQASEEASKHVLVQNKDEVSKRKEEERKFGVFFDDEYDYLQHLKDTEEVYEVPAEFEDIVHIPKQQEKEDVPKLTLPSSVFASELEKPVGLLNQAVPLRGPQLDWDPDIVAGLEEDFDFDDPDNQLEDDFIEVANASGGEEGEIGSDFEGGSDVASDEAAFSDSGDEFDTDFKYGDRQFMDEETKSRFTEYSMSSSVMRRNEGLTLLDDRFEKLFEEYDDSEIGALDQEDIDGNVPLKSQVLDNIMDEFEKQQKETTLREVIDEKMGNDADVVSEESEESDTELMTVEMKPEEKWDCESILSTYSNLYNHPKLIVEPRQIKLKGRLGLPEESLQKKQELPENEVDEGFGNDKASTYRPKGESSDERLERKKAVKQERKERRAEKKMNKKAFTKEKIRQDKEIINLNKNLKTVKIV